MLATTPGGAPRNARRAVAVEGKPSSWSRGPETTDGARMWTMDPGGGDETFTVREPAVARGPGPSASPLFSLTLTLERQPTPDESSLVPLVRGGACAVTLDVTPTDAELASAFPDERKRPTPLFLRGATFALVRTADGQRIAEASTGGFGGRVGLRTTLDTADATAFLRGLRGEPCGIDVVAELSYRAPVTTPPPPFTLDLAAVFAFLDRRTADDRRFLEIDLVNYFALMIERTIVVVRESRGDSEADAQAHLAGLLEACSVILVPVRDLESSYWLVTEAPAPSPERRTKAADDAMQTLTLSRPLHAMLEPLARRYSTDALVSAVCPSRDGGFEPVGARLAQARAGAPPQVLASFGGEAVAMNVALRTGRATKANAAALAHSGLATRLPTQGHWVLDDVVSAPSSQVLPMPQIDDPAAPLWRDRVDAARFWYAPELGIVMPAARDTPDSSPFLFSFRTVGHDATGRPGLEATIRMRLRAGMAVATRQAWEAQKKPPATPVPLGGLSVSLEIPFRDVAGHTQTQAIKATSVTSNGTDHDVTFVLTDQWARLAYGSLASPDFQAVPARISSSYAFTASVRSARSLSGEGARRIEAMAVMRERPLLPPANTVHFPPGGIHVLGPPIHQPHQPLPLPVRPYVTRTQGRTTVVDASLPCATFGALYVQATETGIEAIGCQDAFKLGVVDLKLFERVVLDFGLAAPFQVLRSLQVPGRFLVLPATYTVARFEPGDSRGYRPALFLFANVDADDRDRTRCVVAATLEPAVSPYWRDALLAKLAADVHPTPELTWPGDLEVSPTFEWALTGTGPTAVDVDVVRTPEGFQISLATGVDGVLLLKSMIERSGVLGSVTFPLADGTKLRSALVVDLGHVSGPFVAGPVEIELSGGKAKLTNRVEQPVDIGSLAVRAGGQRKTVAIEKRLAQDESTTATVPAGASQPTADAVPLGEAASFEEIRTYVEDIYVSVVFFANIDFAGVASLSVEAMLAGVEGSVRASLVADAPRAEVTLLLPLTTYISQPTLRFAITRTPRSGTPATGPWRDWRLDTLGSVVEIKTTELP